MIHVSLMTRPPSNNQKKVVTFYRHNSDVWMNIIMEARPSFKASSIFHIKIIVKWMMCLMFHNIIKC